MRALIVDDNAAVSGLVREALEEIGCDADATALGFEATDLARLFAYDVIVLDVMLPDCDGTEVCRDLRRHGIKTPILMITGLTRPSDTVAILGVGADDYLAKPFGIDVLQARVLALVGRSDQPGLPRTSCADLEIDSRSQTAFRDGIELRLNEQEFKLLCLLVTNQGHVVTREEIGHAVWGRTLRADSDVVDLYVSALSGKVDRDRATPLIKTLSPTEYLLSA